MVKASFLAALLGAALIAPVFAQEQVEVWSGDTSQLIVSKLVAIVVVNEKEKVAKEGLFNVRGVQIQGVSFLDNPEFKPILQKRIDKPLTQNTLASITNDILAYYRKKGRKFVDVSSPPQDITNGILQILVLEGKVGNVRVLGSKWFSSSSLAEKMSAKPGEPLDVDAIAADLDWLNRNPFRQVDLVYTKGTQFGQADLLLRTVDKFPFRFYAGLDDSGTKLTQHQRLSAGLTWGNFFGGDGQLDYNFLTSPDLRSFRAHSGSYQHPLPWRHLVTVFGSYADTRANLPEPLALKGYNWQTSLRYEIPFKGSKVYHHSFNAGLDYKKYNNNLTFGGVSVFQTATEVAQFSVGYSAALRDDWGSTSLRGTAYYSPGNLTTLNKRDQFDASRSGAKPQYMYARIEGNRTTGLPLDLTLVNLLTAQASNTNLLASEEIGFGGFDTIRGYDTRIYNSDNGFIFSTELRSPLFPVIAAKDSLKWLDDKAQGLVFLDYGIGFNHLKLPGERPTVHLLSAGLGARYSVSANVSFRADYGWQLLNEAEPLRPYASRAHLGLVVRY